MKVWSQYLLQTALKWSVAFGKVRKKQAIRHLAFLGWYEAMQDVTTEVWYATGEGPTTFVTDLRGGKSQMQQNRYVVWENRHTHALILG